MNKKRCLVIIVIITAVLLLAPSCETVNFPPLGTVNYSPIITCLAAEADWTAPMASLWVTCTASDRDGDQLSYEWSTTGGDISGTGAAVNWTAPEEAGIYDITVVVNDGNGGNDTGSVTLFAATGILPIIQNLTVTAEEPKYLKATSTGYKVGKTKEYYIQCNASGTGELVYDWSCDGGEISGEGALITWTAPNIAGYITVTVIVFDVAGNMDSESVVFQVMDCSDCEFR